MLTTKRCFETFAKYLQCHDNLEKRLNYLTED